MTALIWFKRDLRLHDHAPLWHAAQRPGPLVALYIFEPDYWRQPDVSPRHYACLHAALGDLAAMLAARGQRLVVRVGEAVAVLDALARQLPGLTLWSHQETGNGWTYARDRAWRAGPNAPGWRGMNTRAARWYGGLMGAINGTGSGAA